MPVLLLLLLLLSTPAASAQWWASDLPTLPAAPTATTGELRGIWVDAYGPGFKSPAEVDALIADARALNLNALFVQAVRRGDCYCLRSTLPLADDPALTPGFDPLATLIERAHAADLQVHAWMVTLALWGADTPPSDPAHVYHRHGPVAAETGAAESWLSVRYDGVTRPEADVYLDPGVPAVADYLAGAVVSLAQNYDLDGISFDRLRYPDFNSGELPSWGYNPLSLARFAAETGVQGLPPPSDPAWTAWRREQLTLLARRLYLEAKRAAPSLWVSASTIAYGAPPQDFADSHAYRVVLQDWAGWLRGGFLDLNLPMNYKQNASADAAAWFEGWNRYAPTLEHGALTAVAAGIYLNDPDSTQLQTVAVTGDAALAGWVGYSYRTPSDGVARGADDPQAVRADLAARLTAPNQPFFEPQRFGRPPPLTALLGRVEVDGAAGQGAEPRAGQTVELLRAGKVIATTRADSSGVYGFVLELGDDSADYLLRLEGGVAVPAPVRVGRVATAPMLTRTWIASGEPDAGHD